jgi:hypothetical protein
MSWNEMNRSKADFEIKLKDNRLKVKTMTGPKGLKASKIKVRRRPSILRIRVKRHTMTHGTCSHHSVVSHDR